jgi:hypothetical protein
MREPDPIGMLDTVVEELGKVFLTTEIGGGRTVSPRTVDIAHRGVVNTLRKAGVLAGEPDVPAPPRLVRMTDDGTTMAWTRLKALPRNTLKTRKNQTGEINRAVYRPVNTVDSSTKQIGLPNGSNA